MRRHGDAVLPPAVGGKIEAAPRADRPEPLELAEQAARDAIVAAADVLLVARDDQGRAGRRLGREVGDPRDRVGIGRRIADRAGGGAGLGEEDGGRALRQPGDIARGRRRGRQVERLGLAGADPVETYPRSGRQAREPAQPGGERGADGHGAQLGIGDERDREQQRPAEAPEPAEAVVAERARPHELAHVGPGGLERSVATVIAQVARERGRVARTGAHAARQVVIAGDHGDVDGDALERAVQARRHRRDRGHAERRGEARGIVVRDEDVDIARVIRRVDARSVRLDDGARIGRGSHAREHAPGSRADRIRRTGRYVRTRRTGRRIDGGHAVILSRNRPRCEGGWRQPVRADGRAPGRAAQRAVRLQPPYVDRARGEASCRACTPQLASCSCLSLPSPAARARRPSPRP